METKKKMKKAEKMYEDFDNENANLEEEDKYLTTLYRSRNEEHQFEKEELDTMVGEMKERIEQARENNSKIL